MKRRDLLKSSAAFGLISAIPFSRAPKTDTPASSPNPLKPPAHGGIPVAFLISDGAVMIDFAGPWEVFQDAQPSAGMDMRMNLFNLYTVAETAKPIRASGGMKIIPDHTFATAPAPKVIVIPAQSGRSQATLDWVRKSSKTADVTMSVCTGAFLLAETGLLSGKSATTHHAAFKSFAIQFPDIQLIRGARFVENGNLAAAGGLSSGIDLALRVVERYYGREAATQTAFQMEYQGEGWLHPDSNAVYAQARQSTDEHPLCPVCDMDVDPKTAEKSVYEGQTYYFCSTDHKAQFDAAPSKYVG
jgi:transcriptional regulator GlxA family with amidase domain